MPTLQPVVDALERLGSAQVALAISAALILMLLVAERRMALLFYAAQGVLAATLMLPQLYQSVAIVRIGVALATAILLATLTGRPQPRQATSDRPSVRRGWLTELVRALQATSSGGMGLGFRLAMVVFGAFVVYGLWRAYPLDLASRWTGIALYEMMITGLLMIISHVDPLRKGLGLLTLMNGFQNLYLYLEPSLLVIALWQFLLIILALAIAFCAASRVGFGPGEMGAP